VTYCICIGRGRQQGRRRLHMRRTATLCSLPLLLLGLFRPLGAVTAPPAGRSSPSAVVGTEQQPAIQTYCIACQAAVTAMGSDGCQAACGLLPPSTAPAKDICTWVVGFVSMCADIQDWIKAGDNASSICTHLGFCGSGCQCGVCTAATGGPDGRCLGFPNDCGHNNSGSQQRPSSPGASPWPSFNRSGVSVCLDGQCGDAHSVGCCLTCF
jgi:hypothetical protein